MDFKTLQDLIDYSENYLSGRKRRRNKYSNEKLRPFPEHFHEYNPDLERLSYCLEPLKKLNDLIGMEQLKKNIIDQVLFYSQRLETNEMMHICLTGPPGVGKTTLGKILAELYCSMGKLETKNFNVVTSADLIAGFIGQTALKTRKVLTGSLGGVLFLDEAYSIGTNDTDGYSKECADTINAFLSEHTSNFIMIIAGYQEELDRCFFSLNKGLKRRFPWVYPIEKYTTDNLSEIFFYQISISDWETDDTITASSIKKLFNEYPIFEYNGGDTQTLFDKTKIIHSRRVFGKKRKYKMVLSLDDIRQAAELIKNSNKVPSKIPFGMYV